ncbi:MAG: anthranilate synthase component I [Methanomicrobiaceae archaeon]|nr:anthranilate synthase component I [Methanomicrobiaceae archaeon]
MAVLSEKEKGLCLIHPSPEKLEEIIDKSSENTLIPVYLRLDNRDITPASAYESLRQDYGFLLESMEGNQKNARYSVIGTGLLLHVVADPDVHVKGRFNPAQKLPVNSSDTPTESIYKILRSIDYTDPDILGYSGGLAGYFSYDLALINNNIKSRREKKRDFPLAEFMIPDEYVIFDHAANNLTILRFVPAGSPEEISSEYIKALQKIKETVRILTTVSVKGDRIRQDDTRESSGGKEYNSGISEERFIEIVKKAKEYILNGDIFQVVLSKRCESTFENDPFMIYREMRRINPSPYMYFLDFSDKQVVGASPEMLVKIEGKHITSVPIAGTRKRGKNEDEDLELEKELLSDKKECAEHLMLVDLSRNDIGRVCEYGSVKVTDFMSVEKFSHVQHIVSTVKGTLLEDKTSLDAFISCFPAGTVSGAPKIRAMQIIDELEDTSRGLYAGAVGYIGFNENIDLAITIRTVVVKDNKAYFQSGAGIVADSVPELEYIESENKAKSMKSAIESAGDCL